MGLVLISARYFSVAVFVTEVLCLVAIVGPWCHGKYPPYQSIFAKLSYGESQMLDKAFYEEEVKMLCLAFEQQFHYGVFFAYMRLREQEIRNLMWISECVAQNQKSRVHDSVVFIF
ncbi:hypothetical protein SLA2020_444150 [Shorea laevis]